MFLRSIPPMVNQCCCQTSHSAAPRRFQPCPVAAIIKQANCGRQRPFPSRGHSEHSAQHCSTEGTKSHRGNRHHEDRIASTAPSQQFHMKVVPAANCRLCALCVLCGSRCLSGTARVPAASVGDAPVVAVNSRASVRRLRSCDCLMPLQFRAVYSPISLARVDHELCRAAAAAAIMTLLHLL